MQKLTKQIFLLLLFPAFIFAQKSGSNAAFFSFFAGDLSIISENITKYYGSRNDLTYGVGLGVPLSRSLTLDCSASYYKKESRAPITEEKTDLSKSVLKQLILNAGLQLHLLPNRIVGLSFFFGGNYAFIDEERKGIDGNFVYEIEGRGTPKPTP